MARRLNKLAAWRHAIGKTQAELSEVLGVNSREVQRWESGRVIPEARRWPDYARALNVAVSELTNAIIEITQMPIAK